MTNANPVASGLTSAEAQRRLTEFGENRISSQRRAGALALFIAQFKSPIILILIGAAIVSLFLQDRTDATLILAIVLASSMLGFWQEYSASDAVAKLRALVETKARVLRDGDETSIPLAEVVPGDVVLLSAGAIIPGDGRLLEARELFVNEAALTGETFPAEKDAQSVDSTDVSKNAVFLGTHVVSGSGKAEIIFHRPGTRFGKIAESLRLRPPETEFERGVRRFGYLLAEVTLLLVLAIFAFNVYFHKPVLDSFLFALALAVGLTPQLLPGDHQHQSLAWRAPHGAAKSDRETTGRDRKLRQHECALLGQDRHDHGRQECASTPPLDAQGNRKREDVTLRVPQRR